MIICTTKNQETDRIWGMRQGAKDYVMKPIDEAELLEKIAASYGRNSGDRLARRISLREFQLDLGRRLTEATATETPTARRVADRAACTGCRPTRWPR